MYQGHLYDIVVISLACPWCTNSQGNTCLNGYPNIDYSSVDFIFFVKSKIWDIISKVKHYDDVRMNLLLPLPTS